MQKESIFQMIKFTLFSLSAGIIQVASFALFNEVFGWIYWPAYLTSLILSIVWNFTLNRQYTFKSAANVPVAMLKVALFYAVFTPLSTWWTAVLTSESIGWNEYLVLALTMVINFVTEYLYQRFIVFGKSIDTDKK